MKQICKIRKRPSVWAIIATAFFIALFGMVVIWILAMLAFTSLWFNGVVIQVLVIATLLAPLLVWQSEVRILVEPTEKKFEAFRQLFVFNLRVYQRRFGELDDVYWKNPATTALEVGLN